MYHPGFLHRAPSCPRGTYSYLFPTQPAALDAIRQWTFEPATLGGKPVDVYYNLTMKFQLDSEESDAESEQRDPE